MCVGVDNLRLMRGLPREGEETCITVDRQMIDQCSFYI